MKSVAFYFDFLSPYAYVAWTQIHGLAARTGATVTCVPTLLAALLADGGTKGPAEIPKKRVYVFKDSLRTARVLGLPFGPPPAHPFNPLLALRISGLAMPEHERHAVIDALFAGAWGGGGVALDDPEAVVSCLELRGLPGAALVSRASEPGAKAILRQATDDALARGVFGVPTMRVGDELFWGYDSFGHLERCLRGEDPLGSDELAKWKTLGASAKRRGL